MSTLVRVAFGVVGLIVGVIVAIGFEALLIWGISNLFNRTFYPRGLGWIVGPISVGVTGYSLGYNYDQIKLSRLFGNVANDRLWRLWVSLSLVWVILSVVALYAISPEEVRYWSQKEFLRAEVEVLLPPVGAFLWCSQ